MPGKSPHLENWRGLPMLAKFDSICVRNIFYLGKSVDAGNFTALPLLTCGKKVSEDFLSFQ